MLQGTMRYVSTRGAAPPRDFEGVLLAGLAEDGGLFLPEAWPEFTPAEWRQMRGLPYPELVARVMRPFVAGTPVEHDLPGLARQAYAGFRHPAVVPLVQIDTNIFALELFHGPTLAFKDLALQLVGRLFSSVLSRRRQRITIVGATSGDTGSAAIEACRDKEFIEIVILHPEGRTSEVQRRQMTTVLSDNVANLAINGDFDVCQDLVKAMFADGDFRDTVHLAAVNSINWARIAAQIPYYVAAALALGAPDRPVAVAVPTGNFGNVLAAWAARRMGLPIERLIIASNRNDILARFMASNDMSVHAVQPSLSPSMDIQVSSNFERLLFELLERNGSRTAAMMQAFRREGRMPVPDAVWQAARGRFDGFSLDDAGILAEIRRLWGDAGYLVDPHTAVGTAAAAAASRRDPSLPIIVAATAHPAKFPDAVEQAVGTRPGLPPSLADLYQREERYSVLPADLQTVQAFVRARAQRNEV